MMRTGRSQLFIATLLLIAAIWPAAAQGQPTDQPPPAVGEAQDTAEELPPGLDQAGAAGSLDGYKPDEIFAARGGNLGRYLGRHELTDGRYRFEIDVDRWLSPLITEPGPLQPATLDRLIRQNILPETATLVMQIYDVDHEDPVCPEVDHLYINGEQLQGAGGPARLSSGNATTDVLSFDVPLRMLKFAADPGNTGGRPQAINTVEIDVNVLSCGIGGNSGLAWRVRVDWASLALKLPIQPVVLVHGWASNRNVWREGDHFVRLLTDLGVPYAQPVDYEGGIAPTPRWIRLLKEEVDRVRTQFGVDTVSLIAHSRGGLIARLALEDLSFANKVDALVTLGSPHHGTTLGELSTLIGDPDDPKYDAALTMSRTYVRLIHNYDCNERFRPVLFFDCKPLYRRAPNVGYYSIAEGDNQDGAVNLFQIVDDREATYPWNANRVPFPSQPNVNHTFADFDHSELARERKSHCLALSYLAAPVTSVGPCVAALASLAGPQPAAEPGLAAEAAAPTLHSMTAARTYSPGAQVTLYAGLYDGTAATPRARLSGQLLVPGRPALALRLLDDGSGGDEQAGDGVFTARFTAPDAVGVYGVELRAVDGQVDARGLETLLVAEGTAVLNRLSSVRAADTNRNRLYDELQIGLQLRLSRSGHVRVVGELVAADGQPVARATYISQLRQEAPLGAGLRTVVLSFDGREIRARGLDGPYRLSQVTIYDETDVPLPVYQGQPGYTTTSYRASQFEGPLLAFVAGSHAASDTDRDSRYDELLVTLRFSTALPGQYRWSGRLVDQQGREIGWAAGQGHVDGDTPITLAFEGRRIGNKGLDGPYTIRDMSLTQTSGGSARGVYQNIYTTSAYRADQFERDPWRIYLPLLRR